ncbi:MAG: right-handed parallel beta-helix repeat-containing protein [Bryobacteraceae bacterium]|nr:right-handed parallel beta-helix repeat-containing protein [Bryobacteraceae bacterium]
MKTMLSYYLLLVAAILLTPAAFGRDYFVSPRGDDGGPGSAEAPWRTLERVRKASFAPGDRILLEGGQTFQGPLELSGDDQGTPTHNLVVTSFGEGRAVIDGGKGRAVSIDGAHHVLVERLKLVGAGRKTGNAADGLFLAHSRGSTVNDVEVTGFRHSGIEISGTEDARITRVHAHQNGYAGINSGGDLSKNLYIGYCLTENNAGDPTILKNHSGNGIIVSKVQGALVEYCESRYNGWDQPWTGNGPVGIWTHNADRVVIQYSIAHHNRSTALDGGGFDFDGGVTNSVLQYNYSHSNFGSGYLICQYEGAPRFANNVVRYNVSQDDGLFDHNAGIFVWVGGKDMESTLVHNNTIWNTKGSAVGYGIDKKYAQQIPKIGFYNNIFVSQGPQIYSRSEGVGKLGEFRGNLYWAMGERGFRVEGHKSLEAWAEATGQEKWSGRIAGLFADPMLDKSGTGLLTNPAELKRLIEYRIQKGSPAAGTGLDLRKAFGIDPGREDYYGNRTPEGRWSIGAHEVLAEGSQRP